MAISINMNSGGAAVSFEDSAIKFPTGYVISFEVKTLSEVKSADGIPLACAITNGFVHSGKGSTWTKSASGKTLLSVGIDGASNYAYVEQKGWVNTCLMQMFNCDWEALKNVSFGGNSGSTVKVTMWLKPSN